MVSLAATNCIWVCNNKTILSHTLSEDASSRRMKPISCGARLFERASYEDEKKTFKTLVCQLFNYVYIYEIS